MPRKKKKKADGPAGNFDMLFLQLMMVMMAFFILLNTMAHIEAEKRLKAVSSLTLTFGIMPGGFNDTNKGQPSFAGLPMEDTLRSTLTRTAKAVSDIAKRLGSEDAMHSVPLDKDSVRIHFDHSILFASGQSELSSWGAITMDEMAPLLSDPDVEFIMIQGHADASPSRAGAMGNWSISAKRALSVYEALRDRGVPVRNMAVAGFGDTRPATPGAPDPEKDRRVEIVLKFAPTTSQDNTTEAERLERERFQNMQLQQAQ